MDRAPALASGRLAPHAANSVGTRTDRGQRVDRALNIDERHLRRGPLQADLGQPVPVVLSPCLAVLEADRVPVADACGIFDGAATTHRLPRLTSAREPVPGWTGLILAWATSRRTPPPA